MIDIKLIRENRDLVKENIKKKFQDDKLPLVDEVYEMDKKTREIQTKCDNLKAEKNKLSGEIGLLMKDKKIEEANEIKEKIKMESENIIKLEAEKEELDKKIREDMLVIPQIMDESVPIGKNDTENVEVERFGEPVVPSYEIPHHADIMARFNGIDKINSKRQHIFIINRIDYGISMQFFTKRLLGCFQINRTAAGSIRRKNRCAGKPENMVIVKSLDNIFMHFPKLGTVTLVKNQNNMFIIHFMCFVFGNKNI